MSERSSRCAPSGPLNARHRETCGWPSMRPTPRGAWSLRRSTCPSPSVRFRSCATTRSVSSAAIESASSVPMAPGRQRCSSYWSASSNPTQGTIARGARVQVAYFDQQRDELDPDQSVADSVSDGNDMVEIGGQPRHIIGYLADFLFPRERAVSPVKSLSGGERNRLMLARLFARPANVLVMDEPTNDLDIETLELLEELIADFPGTVLLVSHDRAFLDNIVTSTLAFEGEGRVVESVGGWADYLRHRQRSADLQIRVNDSDAVAPATGMIRARHGRATEVARSDSPAQTFPANSPSTSSGNSTLFPRGSRRSRKRSVASGRNQSPASSTRPGPITSAPSWPASSKTPRSMKPRWRVGSSSKSARAARLDCAVAAISSRQRRAGAAAADRLLPPASRRGKTSLRGLFRRRRRRLGRSARQPASVGRRDRSTAGGETAPPPRGPLRHVLRHPERAAQGRQDPTSRDGPAIQQRTRSSAARTGVFQSGAVAAWASRADLERRDSRSEKCCRSGHERRRN